MHRYAQIVDGRVHCILERPETLFALYDRFYCKRDIELVDITGRDDVQPRMVAELADGTYTFSAAEETEE